MRRRPESTSHRIAAALRPRLNTPPGAVTAVFPAIDRRGRRGARGGTLVAAAQVVNRPPVGDRKIVRPQKEAWQSEMWDLRAEVGELRFAGDRTARALSRCRLFIGKRPAPGNPPVPVDPDTDPDIADLSASMFGDAASSEALRRAGQHLVYNGETELVVEQDPDDEDGLTWAAYSTSEVSGSNLNWKINNGDHTRALGADALLIRCWTPDPQQGAKADAPARAVMPVARELIAMTKYIGAQMDSRLAGAGLLLVPEGIRVPGRDDSFSDVLIESMITPLTDRESAASVVPIVAEVPGDLVDKVAWKSFASPLDEKLHELRDEAIRRIGLGMDSDPALLLGLATANHWSAYSITEDEVLMTVSPLGATVCHALTVGWLRPYLDELGGDSTGWEVWYDTSPLELSPDRSKDAVALYDQGAVSEATVRRETGFGDDDAPGDDERERRLLERLLLAHPEYAPQILPRLGIDIDLPAAATPTEPGAPAAPDTPATPPAVQPAQGPPERPTTDMPATSQEPPR